MKHDNNGIDTQTLMNSSNSGSNIPMEADAIWHRLVFSLKDKFLPYVMDSWISHMHPGKLEEKNLIMEVPDTFTKEWISKHYLAEIRDDIKKVMGTEFDVLLAINSDQPIETEQIVKPATTASFQNNFQPKKEKDPLTTPFNSRYNFENFIIGSSNQFANAACMAVADSPSKAYNPLFLYGASGLGKTHLMQAIGHQVLKKSPKSKVVYISAEDFTNQLINSIKTKTTLKFRNKYRKIDILLIDDIHFLGGKEQTQEEFFHTFNTLYSAHKQIVLSSDRSPKELKNVEERLVSRFEWGLIADLQPPDVETRIAIIRRKAEAAGIELEDDISYFIASNIKNNIRKLEGSLIRLISYSSLTGTPISLDLAKEILRDIIETEKEAVITIELIQKKVSEYFDIRIGDIKSNKRPQNIAIPRQIAMYMGRNLTNLSLKEIGDAFGGKDHTTVIHAIKKVETKLKSDDNLKKTMARIEEMLKSSE